MCVGVLTAFGVCVNVLTALLLKIREFLFKHPRRTATLSMRNTSVMKKGGIFSAEFLKVFLPSLLLSHLLAIGLG